MVLFWDRKIDTKMLDNFPRLTHEEINSYITGTIDLSFSIDLDILCAYWINLESVFLQSIRNPQNSNLSNPITFLSYPRKREYTGGRWHPLPGLNKTPKENRKIKKKQHRSQVLCSSIFLAWLHVGTGSLNPWFCMFSPCFISIHLLPSSSEKKEKFLA